MTVVVTWLEVETSTSISSSGTVNTTGSSVGALRVGLTSSRSLTISGSSAGTLRITGTSTRTISVTGTSRINQTGDSTGTSTVTINLAYSSIANIYFNESLRRYVVPSRSTLLNAPSRTYSYTTSNRVS